MATHDYDIANQSGAAFRTDLNNALAAIQSNNSNSSSPATTVAYQWWADTTSGTLKIRNSANNAWIELLQLDGTLTLEDGSNSAPALAFRDDLDTGIYSDSANEFNIATGGVERVSFANTGVVINQTGADTDTRIEGSSEANLFYVNAGDNKIGIGVSSPEGLLHILNSTAGAVTAASDADELVLEASSNVGMSFLTANDSLARIKFADTESNGVGAIIYNHQNDNIQLNAASAARVIIASDMISARQDYAIARTAGGYTFRETNEGSERAGILSNSSNVLIFNVGSASEKMRLTSSSSGQLIIGNTVEPTGGASGVFLQGNGFAVIGYAGTGSNNVFEFNNANGNVGRINCNGSNTTYLTTSDYRLKENASAISDGITRLKTLKPYRFNFKTEPSVTQDGFFAHEVSSAVPIAVLGEKDATKEDGSIDPQGIDHSQLVPLLVAAVQELIGKVEALEAA